MTDSLPARCAAFADEYGMLPPAGGQVLCAVSGGADSVCLLLLLRELGAARGFAVSCAHFDHRLRGAESTRDADFVRALCARLDVVFRLGGGDVRAYAAQRRLGVEAAAREARYAFLEAAADELGAARIATAHTADDNAETMLLNLARGAGSRGLAGIPPVRGRLIRPLLAATREEVEAEMRARGQDWVTDSSNLGADYARNRVRQQAVPVLREINPRFARHALAAAAHLREDEAYLSGLAARFVAERGTREDGCLRLPAAALRALPAPVQTRVLAQACGTALGEVHLRALRALLAEGRGGHAADVPGLRVYRDPDSLVFGEATPETLPERELLPGGALCLPELGLEIRRTEDVVSEVHNSFNIFFFKKTEVCGKILVRPKKPGDKLRPAGRGCTKSLKRLFAEARVPAARRGLIPVIADERGVLAVYGFGADMRRAAPPGEAAVKIELAERQTE